MDLTEILFEQIQTIQAMWRRRGTQADVESERHTSYLVLIW